MFVAFLGCARTPEKVRLPEQTPVKPEETIVAEEKPGEASIPVYTAKVAFIIDDAGHNLKALDETLALPVPVNVAVLPRLGYSKKIAQSLHDNGFEIILHQPMEPKGAGIDPGPGAIYTGMTEEEIKKILEENFKAVPHLVGLNNHMGSKATADQTVMEVVLRTASENNLFFIDSVTSRSKVNEAAENVGVRVLERDIFLDNEKDPAYIKNQIRKLKRVALKKGQAVGIGHFFPVTIQSISEMLPEFEAEGIQVVPVSKLSWE